MYIKNTQKYRNYIVLIIYLAYTCIYVARVNLSIATPELIRLNLLDSAQIGMLGSCFFCIYAVGRIINGTLSDMTKPWRMLLTGLLITGISNFFMSGFPSYGLVLLLWSLNAYGQSMLWSSILCVVTSLYEGNEAKRKSSVMVSSVAVGNLLGIVLNSYLIASFGVKFAFVVPGMLAMIFGLLTAVATKNIDQNVKAKEEHHSLLHLLKDGKLLLINLTAVIHGVMKENISLWMAVYIVDTYLVDLTTSSYYILLIPTIGLAGRMIYPIFFKMYKEDEQKISLSCFVLCAVAAGVLCFKNVGMLAAAIALGIIYMMISMINTSLLSIYPLRYAETGNTASVSGLMDFSTYLGAGISSAIYGVVIKYFGYLPMFVSWIIISFLSVAILLKLRKAK